MAIQLDSTKGITNVTWTSNTRPTLVSTGTQGFNTTTGQMETWSGSAWVSGGGGGGTIAISNDTTTSSTEFPMFANASSGNLSTAFTSSGNLTFKPSTGGLTAVSVAASQGVLFTANTVTQAIAIPSGYNGLSAGAVALSGGSVSIPCGSAWVIDDGASVTGKNNIWTGTNTFNNTVSLNKNVTIANTLTANGSVGNTSQVLLSGGACASPRWLCSSALVAAASPNVVSYTSSTTFNVATPGTYTIHVIGGGGSGGVRRGCSPRSATGGGAGGYARKTALLAAGCYTITIGAGGTAYSGAPPGSGNPGGASSFSGPGITTITANGGPGGNQGGGSAAGVSSGGTATGGDVNVTGGGSGCASTGLNTAATGGGAVGVIGTGYSSLSQSGPGCTNGAGVGGSNGTAGNGGMGYAFPFGGLIGGVYGGTSGPGAGQSASCGSAGIFGGGRGGGCSRAGYGGGGGGRGSSGCFSGSTGGGGIVIITH